MFGNAQKYFLVLGAGLEDRKRTQGRKGGKGEVASRLLVTHQALWTVLSVASAPSLLEPRPPPVLGIAVTDSRRYRCSGLLSCRGVMPREGESKELAEVTWL